MKIPFFKPSLGQDEIDAAVRVLQTPTLTQGPETEAFEDEFRRFQGASHCVAVNSGTSALYLALKALDVGPGDEVITTPISWVATALAIRWTGAKVVFADVMPYTGLLDPDSVASRITSRTRAIVPVHLHGRLVDIGGFLSLRTKIPFVWDCAHAIEASLHGSPIGSIPDVACYSFFGSKNLTTAGEGGAVVTSNPVIDRYVRRARLFGLSLPEKSCVQFGGKFVMTEVQAAVGRLQLRTIFDRWEKRRALHELYASAFPHNAIAPRSGEKWAYHLFATAATRLRTDPLAAQLASQGIGTGFHYRPITDHPMFNEDGKEWWSINGNAEIYGRQTISLPFYPDLSLADAETVIRAVIATEGL